MKLIIKFIIYKTMQNKQFGLSEVLGYLGLR